jgi:heat shock protein HslJ
MKIKTSILVLLPFVLGLTACSSVAMSDDDYKTGTVIPAAPAESPSDTTTETRDVSIEDRLRNLTYQDIYDEPVTLANGQYKGEPFVESDASKPTITLILPAAFGDLNGDRVDDAAVLLVENSGGSGSFVFLSAVLNNKDGLENVATTLLGDRVVCETVDIVDGQMVLELTSHAEDDPMCCPSVKTRTTYALANGKITVVRTELLTESDVTRETTVPDQLLGSWLWLAYHDTAGIAEITVADPSKYAVKFLADGTAQIKADCNSASSYFTLDGGRLTFAPGPMTLAECESGSLYAAFLEKLSDVATYVFSDDGYLILNLKMDVGNMIFTPVPAT